MVRFLNNNGYQTDVVTALPNYPRGKVFKGYRNRLYFRQEYKGIKVTHLPIYPSKSRSISVRFISTLTFSIALGIYLILSNTNKYKFIISETPPLNVPLITKFLKSNKSKMVLNVSDLWPLALVELQALKKDGWLHKLLEQIEQNLYSGSDLILAQSDESNSYISERTTSTVLTFRNAVTVKDYYTDYSLAKYSTNKIKLVYAGLLGLTQGMSDIIGKVDFKALGFELHIYGDGIDKNAVKEGADESNGVFFHGYIGSNELQVLLCEYHISFIPFRTSVYGAVPAKLYENAAAGLPVLLAGEGESADIITQNNLGWVCSPSSVKDLTATLEHIKSLDLNEIRRIGIHCRSIAEKKFDRSVQNVKLLKALEAIV